MTCGQDVMAPYQLNAQQRAQIVYDLERAQELREQATKQCERRTAERDEALRRAGTAEATLAEVAWHPVQYDEEDKPQCTGCLSDGDDECPVMKIVKTVPCPFPDEP